MNLKEIREIIQMMNDNELTEIEVEREGSKLKIRKSASDMTGPFVQHSVDMRPHMPQVPAAQPPAPEADTTGKTTKQITSPMVGTFYRAPSPESPAFVEVGQVVEIGQVVCIVEAMKLMNEIKSEVKGRIAEVPVENAEPVEFGQTLFEVQPL